MISTDSDTDVEDVIEDDHPTEYKVETWGKNVDGVYVIDGYKFKGRQPFRKAKEELEKLIVRGPHYKIGNFTFNVLDARNKGIELEADVALKGSDNKNRGVAILKLYGPNKRKENTVTVTKSRQSDIHFVTLMAEKVIKPLLKMIIEEKNFSKEAIETQRAISTIKCKTCDKTFKTKPGLKTHITKKHRDEQEVQLKEKVEEEDAEVTETEFIEDVINLNERADEKEKKTYSCNKCEKGFSRKYELIKHSLKHKQKLSNQCPFCDSVSKDEQQLKRHKRDHHDLLSVSTSPPPKKVKATLNTSKNIEEDMDIDSKETLENMNMDIDCSVTEEVIRSKLMDEKIQVKAEKIEEEERLYQERKLNKENSKTVLKEKELEKQKQLIKQNRQKLKNEKKRTRKKNLTIKDTESVKIVPNIKPVPNNIAHLVKEGDKVYCVPGDGACGPNSIAAHLFKDEVYGPKLKRQMNIFMVKHWERKYKNKTQCSQGHPFKRRLANFEEVSFTDSIKLLEFLEKSEDAAYMWTDSEDLIVVADMYQLKIQVISTTGENDKNPRVYWILPDEEMKQFAELKDVELDDMTLLHERDTHFNLIVAKDSDLAKVGSLSFRSNIGPCVDVKDTVKPNDSGKKTFAEAVINGDTEDKDIEIKNLKLTIKKCNDKISLIEKQYDECEKALRKKTEDFEKIKSELNDLKAMRNLEKELKETQNEELSLNKGIGNEIQCLECDWKCSQVMQLQKHKQQKHSAEPKACEKTFSMNKELEDHKINEHTTITENFSEENNIEEEFNCTECPFQGSEQNQLSKHVKLKHRIECRNCSNSFKTKPELMVHRKIEHYNTIAMCNKGAECKFFERCWWKHEANDSKHLIECYFCDETFATKNEVMMHRKDKHSKTVKSCTKFENQTCKNTEATCWFKHNEAENLVFRDHPNKFLRT